MPAISAAQCHASAGPAKGLNHCQRFLSNARGFGMHWPGLPGMLCYGLLGLCLNIAGCADPESPEQQIRQMVDQGEAAVEEGAHSEIKSLISDSYLDEAGRNRRALAQLVAGYMLRHGSIHLLTQIDRIEIQGPEDALLSLYVAMAARPLQEAGQLLSVRADLLRFDLVLRREDGQWRVISGQWRRASREDFLR